MNALGRAGECAQDAMRWLRVGFGRGRLGDVIPVTPDGFWRGSAPARSLHEAARLFDRLGGETIVEIGTGLHGAILYLDFPVPDPAGTVPGTGRAEAYRAAYLAASGKMSPHLLILIDDTDHVPPWKDTLLVPEARKDGYRVLHAGRQTLLER